MKPTLIDRVFVIWIAAALAVWAAALAILWAMKVDLSGTGLLRALAALMLATWATAGLPGRAARGLQRLFVLLKLQDPLAMELAMAGGASVRPEEARAMTRLLAGAAAVAAAGGLASTGAVYLGAAAAEAAAKAPFLWGPAAWAALKLLLEVLGMVPMALGISVAFLVTGMIRGGSGRDQYASVVREWLSGVAAGLVIVALAWWLGADVLGGALVACVALLAAAGGLFQRVRLTIRPRRQMPPIDASRQWGRRLAVGAGFALVTLALRVQTRLLRDVAGVALGGQACWLAASLALLAWFLRQADRKSRPPSEAQGLAAAIGAVSGLVLQASLAVLCLRGGARAVGLAALAVAAQMSLAALASVVLSRHRRLFATHGGRPRQYLSAAAAGVAAGLLLYLAAGALSVAAASGLALAVGAVGAGVVALISKARRPGVQLQWAALGGLLLCATAAAPLAAPRGLPRLKAGAWLTTASGAAEADGAAMDCTLGPRHPRSEAVTAAIAEVLAGQPGRWWIVTSSPQDVPRDLPAPVRPVWAHPDATAAPGPGAGRDARRPWGDFLDDLARDPSRFDGILLAPMPAEHPEAWRCYGAAVLRGCRQKLHGGGLLVLRTQAGEGRADSALAAASAFAQAARTGWAVLAMSEGHLDMALIARRGADGGPADGEGPRPLRREGVFVVPLERLLPSGWSVPASRLSGRGVLLRRTMRAETLREYWRRAEEQGGR